MVYPISNQRLRHFQELQPGFTKPASQPSIKVNPKTRSVPVLPLFVQDRLKSQFVNSKLIRSEIVSASLKQIREEFHPVQDRPITAVRPKYKLTRTVEPPPPKPSKSISKPTLESTINQPDFASLKRHFTLKVISRVQQKQEISPEKQSDFGI
jgi:hypothetical protein